MDRYLVRLENRNRQYAPQDAKMLAASIRKLLGSHESIGNLRVSRVAIEFDLFADEKQDLDQKIDSLEENVSSLLSIKLLEKSTRPLSKTEILEEAVEMFSQERYWEAHEILEQVWQPARGVERDTVQGLILTAAGLVHHQKDRDSVSLGILEKALSKLEGQEDYEGIDVARLRAELGEMLRQRTPREVVLAMRVSRRVS